MEETKDLRQTYSSGVAIGTLKEKAVDLSKEKFDDGETYDQIKGDFVLDINGNDYKFHVFSNSHWNSLTENNKHKKNFRYQDIVTILEAPINSKLGVNVTFDRFNDYKTKRGSLASIDIPSVNAIEIKSNDAEDMFEGKIEGLIYRIEDEIVNENATGRKIITLMGIGYDKGKCALPHKIYVDTDLADQIENVYDIGNVVTLDIAVEMRAYGTTNKSGGIFSGGRNARILSGFTREEWIMINGSEPLNEESINKKGENLFFTLDDMKPLIEKRNIKLEAIMQGASTDVSESKSGLSNMNFTELKDEDLPF